MHVNVETQMSYIVTSERTMSPTGLFFMFFCTKLFFDNKHAYCNSRVFFYYVFLLLLNWSWSWSYNFGLGLSLDLIVLVLILVLVSTFWISLPAIS